MAQRRSITRFTRPVVLIVGLLSSLPGAPANAEIPSAPAAVESVLTAGATLIPRLDGSLEVIRGDQREVLTLADGSERIDVSVAPVPTESSVYICFDKKWDPKSNPNRVTYPPVAIAAANGRGHIQYVVGVFRLDDARKTGPTAVWQRQWEACSRGLGQADVENWRLAIAGGTSADTNDRFTRIGWDFRTGDTPPKYTLTYGFAQGVKLCAGVPVAKACSDSSISAAIEQHKSGWLRGGFKAPMGTLRDNWTNGVAGWWDGNEVGGAPAYQSQGTVIHSLWEYPMNDPVGVHPALYAEVYAKFVCTRWFGLGCAVDGGP